jgi:hypothetical protein
LTVRELLDKIGIENKDHMQPHELEYEVRFEKTDYSTPVTKVYLNHQTKEMIVEE